jgi:hypothetical protein
MISGNEYLTSNAAIAFPFKEDAAALAHDGVAVHGIEAMMPPDLLVDAVMFAAENVTEAYLSIIFKINAEYFILIFNDQNDNTTTFVPVDMGTWDMTQHYQLITHHNPYGTTGTIKLVITTDVFVDYVAGIVALDRFERRLQLESTVLNTKVPTVQTFELYEELPDIPEPEQPGPITGRVQLLGGYNTETYVDPNTTEGDTLDITMDMVPLAGEGLAPCQHEQSDVHKGLMEVKPDENGNIQLTMGDENCYSIIPHPDLGVFEIHGSCEACCSCEDYERVAKAIHRLLLKSQDIYNTLLDAQQDHYTPGVAHYNEIIAPRYIGPIMQVNGSGGAYWDGDPNIRSGAEEWVNIVVGVKNNTADPLQLRQLSATISIPASYTIRQMSWEYAGQADQIDDTDLAGGIDLIAEGLPTLARGAKLTIYISAYVPFPADPVWTGTVALNCQQDPDNGGAYWDLTDDFEVD